METNTILESDVLDIIFDGRNKQYGAYQLRKSYNRRLGVALAVMFSICLLAVVGKVLAGNEKKNPAMIIAGPVIDLADYKEKKQEPIHVEPPKPKELPKVEIKQFTAPKLIDKDPETPPPANDDLDNTQIGTINQDGIKSSAVLAEPVEPKGTGENIQAPKVIDDIDKERYIVQVQAQFPGGADAWRKFLERNLKQDIATDNGAPTGDYQVVISFLVDRSGNVTEVKAENDPGYGVAAEAIRVIQRSGKWIPAIQNGRNVIYRQKQSIIFRVSEQ